MDEQREQPKDERPEVTGELSETELEQASGGRNYCASGQHIKEATLT